MSVRQLSIKVTQDCSHKSNLHICCHRFSLQHPAQNWLFSLELIRFLFSLFYIHSTVIPSPQSEVCVCICACTCVQLLALYPASLGSLHMSNPHAELVVSAVCALMYTFTLPYPIHTHHWACDPVTAMTFTLQEKKKKETLKKIYGGIWLHCQFISVWLLSGCNSQAYTERAICMIM